MKIKISNSQFPIPNLSFRATNGSRGISYRRATLRREIFPLVSLGRDDIFFKFLVLILTFALFLTSHSTAFAEEISLGVSPPILRIEANPPSDIRSPFTVENLGDEPVDLKIAYKLFKAAEQGNGQIEYLREKDPFPGANPKFFEQIEIVDEDNFSIDSLSLGPKQKAKLILRILVPKKEPFSDYYFSLIFLNQPEKTAQIQTKETEETDTPVLLREDKTKERNSASLSQTGIAMNVLISIGPNDASKGHIQEFSTDWYRESGPVPFTIKLKNSGSHVISPKGVITIKNMFGQTIGRIELAQSNILAGSSRYFINDKLSALNSQPPASRSQKDEVGSTPAALWTETFLLGFYTATLKMAMSDQGPLYTRSIHFLAIPVKLFIGIAIASIILVLAYLRIKNKLSSE